MEDFKEISPLMDKWTVEEKLETDGIAEVYTVSSDGSAVGNLAVLKHYSYPRTPEQLEALFYTGAVSTNEEARAYLARDVKEQAYELSYIQQLKDCPHVFTSIEYQITEKKDSIGFDIYVITDYAETLSKYVKYNAMTHLRTVNLGLDICSALEELRANGFIHRNLKPSNIYVSPYGQFMLGDFGFGKIDSLAGSFVPEHYISEYSAPELSDLRGEPNETIDIYSLGLVLYRILNANHAPFEDESTSAAAAAKRREQGEDLPFPMFADYELGQIVLKACAFDPKDRYQTPTEFRQALNDYYLNNKVTDDLVVPPINTGEDEEFQADLEEVPEPVQNVSAEDLDEDFKNSFTPQASGGTPEDHGETGKKERKKATRGFLLGMLIVCAVICVSGFFAFKYWPTVEIYNINTEVAGSDVIIVSWETGGYNEEYWSLSCSDAYGNKKDFSVNGTSYVITDLTPGTQYNITLSPYHGYIRTEGLTKASVATVSHTTLSEFTAAPVSSTEIDLNWVVDGTAPDLWSLTYTVGGQEIVREVTGNSYQVQGLVPGEYYTFTLTTDCDTLVSGTSVVSAQAPWHTEISGLKAESPLPSTVELSWDVDGHEPDVWLLTCTASDGSYITNNVVGTEWTVENLVPNTDYTFTVEPSGNYELEGENNVECTTAKCEIVAIDVTSDSPFTASVKWTVDGVAPGEWYITYGAADGETLQEIVYGDSITMNALYPDTTCVIKISAAAEYCLGGETETTFTTAKAEAFTDYGCSNVEISLYKATDTEFAEPVTTFTAGDEISLVISAEYEATEEDKTVTTVYFIRDESGKVISFTKDSRTWSGTWTETDHTDTITDLPEEPGTYTLEVYFNDKILATKKFAIQ